MGAMGEAVGRRPEIGARWPPPPPPPPHRAAVDLLSPTILAIFGYTPTANRGAQEDY